ncbi:MAG: WbuC family cupin fold metalloprotein [Rhodospirillales bacterium]
MSNATFATGPIVSVSADMVADLKSKAAAADSGRFRFCLHQSVSENTQEMVIACRRDTVMPPHRHPEGRSESYHVIEGAMTVLFFGDDGALIDHLDMGAHDSGKPYLYRLGRPVWHTAYPTTEWLVYHEVLTGPFDIDQVVEYPDWLPQGTDTTRVAAFLDRAAATANPV